MELSGDTFRLEIHDIVANDTHGVGPGDQPRGAGRAEAGGPGSRRAASRRLGRVRGRMNLIDGQIQPCMGKFELSMPGPV
jgi:hypothetical protein